MQETSFPSLSHLVIFFTANHVTVLPSSSNNDQSSQLAGGVFMDIEKQELLEKNMYTRENNDRHDHLILDAELCMPHKVN